MSNVLRNFVLMAGFVACSGALAVSAPARLSQGMMPFYSPVGGTRHYAGFQPPPYRPMMPPSGYGYRQNYPASYPVNYSGAVPGYGFRQGYQSYPVARRYPPTQYMSVPPPPPAMAYGYYPRGVQSSYPMPRYQRGYQYPQARYAGRLPYASYPTPYPIARSVPRPFNPYVSTYAMRSPTYPGWGYVPRPMYQQPGPIHYGRNSGFAYQFYPVRYSGARYGSVPRQGYQPLTFTPYRYMPGQNLMAKPLSPASGRQAPTGRYIPSGYPAGRMGGRLTGYAGGMYRFRPDSRFFAPDAPGAVGGDAWRSENAIAENSAYRGDSGF